MRDHALAIDGVPIAPAAADCAVCWDSRHHLAAEWMSPTISTISRRWFGRPSGGPVGVARCARRARPGQDLVVQTDRGEVLVPFVRAIVLEVDLAGGRVLLDPPAGLFD